jgi:hypothetical protein
MVTRAIGWRLASCWAGASLKTVDAYRSRLMQKLDIDSIAGPVKFTIACGLTSP